MRQDSESGSSSDVDAEAVAKRKSEALIDKPAKGAADDDVGKSDKRRKSESSDSGGSDFSDFGDQTDIIDDEDAKMSVFHREVLESMQRGFAEGINADNLSLEINSSRHAYAATAKQGRLYSNLS